MLFRSVAAWAAARSSPRLHAWLLAHSVFGPLLQNWNNGRLVSRRAKWSAAVGMSLCALLLWLGGSPLWVALPATTCMVLVLAWLCSRPETLAAMPPADDGADRTTITTGESRS